MIHQTTRVRHESRRRRLTVKATQLVTPAMLRIVLAGPELDGFTSSAPDDHIKLFIPDGVGGTVSRDYTPRTFDPLAQTLSVDFAMHDAGPATQWARTARPGDAVEIGGPRGSLVVPYSFDWWLLIGDETALPAIARRLEEMPDGTKVITVVAVTGPDEEQRFDTRSDHIAIWAYRSNDEMADPSTLLAALKTLELPAGEGFVWLAAEAEVSRRVRTHILGELRHPPSQTRMSGYWQKGAVGAHVGLD